jgi:acetyltransferase-like isoleucine patch superfamily enzyme
MRKSNYGLTELIKQTYFLIKTRILYRNVRLIRFPIIVRGKKFIDFGSNLVTGYRCRIEVNGKHTEKKIIFGNNVNIGDNVRISSTKKILIGSNVLMGSGVLIIDNSHGKYSGNNQDTPYTPPNNRALISSEIKIGDNVWIGEKAVIQMGCTVGSGSIIGANSVVTKSIPSNVIAGGVPAKVIKVYDEMSGEWRKVL